MKHLFQSLSINSFHRFVYKKSSPSHEPDSIQTKRIAPQTSDTKIIQEMRQKRFDRFDLADWDHDDAPMEE